MLTSAYTFENSDDYRRYNVEILEKKCPSGFPRHVITLKERMHLMLLFNISPKEGLCNGTKLIFHRTLNNKLLLCTVGGTQKQVLIPRIKFIHVSNLRDDCDWARRQFLAVSGVISRQDRYLSVVISRYYRISGATLCLLSAPVGSYHRLFRLIIACSLRC